jgi:hypothetical protein
VNQQHFLIAVEGNHDQSFIGRVLQKALEFCKFEGTHQELKEIFEIDQFWRKFIPIYPSDDGKVYERLNPPSFFYNKNQEIYIGIYVGGGSSLVSNLELQLSNNSGYLEYLSGFAVIADADRQAAHEVANNYSKGLADLFPGFGSVKNCIGQVVTDPLRMGIYILPNNKDQGVLENLMTQCGSLVYIDYLEKAEAYIQQFLDEENKLLNSYSHLKWKPFDREKALIATVVSVLQPGCTNTVSIAQDKWISKETLEQVPDMVQLVRFLKALLGIED